MVEYAENWVDGAFQTTVERVSSDGMTLQIFHVTDLIGFPDDMWVRAYCNTINGTSVLEVKSQSRLGTDDSGVNLQRVKSLIHSVNAELTSASGGGCS